MIVLPSNHGLQKDTVDLIGFFNALEKQMQWPNSEGYADQRMFLKRAELELIKAGRVTGR